MFDEIMSFFEDKTQVERMPRRSDFTPRDLQKYLPYIGLLEFKFNDKGEMIDAFCRLNGSLTITIYGDLTGKWLSDMEIQESFIRIKKRYKIMSEKRQGFAVASQIVSKAKEYTVVRALYIPLSEDNKKIDKLLLVIDYDSPDILRSTPF